MAPIRVPIATSKPVMAAMSLIVLFIYWNHDCTIRDNAPTRHTVEAPIIPINVRIIQSFPEGGFIRMIHMSQGSPNRKRVPRRL